MPDSTISAQFNAIHTHVGIDHAVLISGILLQATACAFGKPKLY